MTVTDLGAVQGERAESVSRVLAALSTVGDKLTQNELRGVLASEGHSMVDVPEVGLFLALMGTTLTGDSATAAAPEDHATNTAPGDDETLVIDLRADAADPRGTAINESRKRLRLRRRLASIVRPAPAHETGHTPIPDPFSLHATLRDLLGTPLSLALSPAGLPGTATPEPYLPQAVARSSTRLNAYLRSALAVPIVLRMPPGDAPSNATLDPWWHPTTVRQLTELAGFLDSLFALPTDAPVAVSRLAGASNGAVPDPYWPRHLVRAGRASDRSTPRSSDVLEADLAARLADVSLVGEADVEDSAAEMEISLSQLVRRESLDRLGRVYPATLASFLVRHARLHHGPADFDAAMPIGALRRSNPLGLAFSEALVRLGKPVFREVEQRDVFDHRVRYLRRMQLHVGVVDDVVDAVVEEVRASFVAGATTGREVAADWLAARGAVHAAIGDGAYRLLTHTDHGASMLEALVDLVREPSGTTPEPLTEHLAAVVRRSASDADHTAGWDASARPRIRRSAHPAGGPVVELPPIAVRWHLNGELLTYGSPAHNKVVDLPLSRSGKWAITVGTSRRSSPLDVVVQSAATDRIVLVFDEHDRHHPHPLPLGGTTARVISPVGGSVTGEVSRVHLTGRWSGFEEIEVDISGLDHLEVTHRGRAPLAIPVDHNMRYHLVAPAAGSVDPWPSLVFRGHVPASAEISVSVAGHHRATTLTESSPPRTIRGIALGPLLHDLAGVLDGPSAAHLTLTVSHAGFEPSVANIDLSVDNGADVQAWASDPVAAARATTWNDVRDRDRWETATGWRPPTDGPAAALGDLVRPLLSALDGGHDAEQAPTGGLLDVTSWRDALASADLPDEWIDRNRRPLWRWATAHPALRNLEPIWNRFHGSSTSRAGLLVVTAAMLAEIDGPYRAEATARLDAAAEAAPKLTSLASIFAIAYVRVQQEFPPSRFQPIAFR